MNTGTGGEAPYRAPSEDDTRAFRAVQFIDAAKRLEIKAAQLMQEANEYRHRANRLLGGTASTPEPRL